MPSVDFGQLWPKFVLLEIASIVMLRITVRFLL